MRILGRHRRLALVIGNSEYTNAEELQNPKNDAQAMSHALHNSGFEIVSHLELGAEKMRTVFREFLRSAKGANVALIFFSGHGVQVDGENYLLPIDIDLDPENIKEQSVAFSQYLNEVSAVSTNCLVFIDACRNNPSRSIKTRSVGANRKIVVGPSSVAVSDELQLESGLAAVDFPSGEKETFIAFATAPGTTAYDGSGGNSPFTEALVRYIGIPGLALSDVAQRVINDVRRQTKQRQTPWINSCMTRPFYFKRRSFTAPLMLLVFGAISGLVSYFLSDFGKWGPGAVSVFPGICFALVIALGVRQWAERSSAPLIAAIFTIVAWYAANFAYMEVSQRVEPIVAQKLSEIRKEEDLYKQNLDNLASERTLENIAEDDYSTRVEEESTRHQNELERLQVTERDIEFLSRGLPGMIAGALGAAIISIGGALSVVALRRIDVVAMSTLLGAAVIPIVGLMKPELVVTTDATLVTMILWQSLVAGSLGLGFSAHIQEIRTDRTNLWYWVKPPVEAYVCLLGALGSAVLSTLFLTKESAWSLADWQPIVLSTPLGPSLTYGIVIAYATFAMKKPDMGYAIIHFVTTNLAWIAAMNTAQSVPLPDYYAILIGGLIGASITLAGPSLSIPILRHPITWILVIATGVLAALPFAFWAKSFSENETTRYLMLFLPWQISVTAALTYGLLRPEPEGSRTVV